MKKYAVLFCLILGGLMLPLSGCMYSTAYEIPSQYKECVVKAPASKKSAKNNCQKEQKGINDPSPKPVSADQLSAPQPNEVMPVLINAEHTLPEDYVPDSMACIGNTSYKMVPEAAKACENLLAAADKDGICGLQVISAYRSYQKQTTLFAQKISAYRDTYGTKAETLAAAIVAPAGESEHQSGLAVDICTGSSLVASFGETPEGKWLEKNCWSFGFVIRYPDGKSDITGITYEPWHLRYVGIKHAKTMTQKGLCLEEYLSAAPNRKVNS